MIDIKIVIYYSSLCLISYVCIRVLNSRLFGNKWLYIYNVMLLLWVFVLSFSEIFQFCNSYEYINLRLLQWNESTLLLWIYKPKAHTMERIKWTVMKGYDNHPYNYHSFYLLSYVSSVLTIFRAKPLQAFIIEQYFVRHPLNNTTPYSNILNKASWL